MATANGWRVERNANQCGGDFDWAERKDIGDPKKAYEFLIGNGNSGFNALLGGGRNSNGEYLGLGRFGYCWSATGSGADNAWLYSFGGDGRRVYRSINARSVGLSCRCLKD